MPFSYPKQFWTWFQQNEEYLTHAQYMGKKESDYWMREIDVHLRAFTKNLKWAIIWDKSITRFVITTVNRPKYFAMAGKFVAKAPVLKGWEFFALHPANVLSSDMLEHLAEEAGLDASKCWFVPPLIEGTQLTSIYVYAEIYTEVTQRMEDIARLMVNNALGERLYATEVSCVYLDSVFNRTEKEKEKPLLPLDKLPEYVLPRKRPELFVTAWGKLTDSL